MKARQRSLPLLVGVGLLLSLDLLAQQKARVWRVGILAPSRRPEVYGALTAGLKDLGYVEGKNLEIVMRSAEGDYTQLPTLAAQLVELPVDVIVTDATPGAVAAKKATTTIPIVFNVGDPVGAGLVKSLTRPGGNATGMSVLTMELSVKRLELLIQAAHKVSSVAVLFNPSNTAHPAHIDVLRASVKEQQIELIAIGAGTREEIESAFSQMTEQNVSAFMVLADPFLNQQLRQVAELAAKYRLPGSSLNPVFAEAGGLMSYGADPRENFRHLATIIDKIFKGANPGELPVEQPTTIHLALNRKTFKALGLEIPPELLVLADKVIE